MSGKCFSISLAFVLLLNGVKAQSLQLQPSAVETVSPIVKADFTNGNACAERKQGGTPTTVNGHLVFKASGDGNRQVDPQVAVGGGYIMEGSNSGLVVYDKNGNYLKGVSQKCFNNGIDPKLFFDLHNRVFIFDLWWYYDKEKTKPVNIAVSQSSNPLQGWYIYPVSRTKEVDGGGIGYSRKWVGYSYPGGEENTFVMKSEEIRSGLPAKVYHFKGSLGHPVFVQDAIDDLYFFEIDDSSFVIRKLSEDANGHPYGQEMIRKKHGLTYIDYPPSSPQKGSKQLLASGDRNPKNIVLQGGCLWFSQAVNCEGRSAVQWLQIRVKDGKILQKGLISSPSSSYIQTSVAVNRKNDLLVGFQEVGEQGFASPRMAYRKAGDRRNQLRPIVSLGEGQAATEGESWGDYSGAMVDGDNLTDLWTIQSMANEKGRNQSVIARYKP